MSQPDGDEAGSEGAGPPPGADPPEGADPPGCRECGGELITGSLALPILGRARFAYSLRGRAIETDVDSHMCAKCGAITFHAADPERIRRAAEADRRAELFDRMTGTRR